MILKTYQCEIVDAPVKVRQGQLLRGKVFSQCGYLTPELARSGHEQSPWDLHGQAVHFLVRDNRGYVGAARLIVGRLHSDCPELGYGVPIEAQFGLGALSSFATCVAEVGRVCVLEDHRGLGAAQALYAGLARESLRLGVERWVGLANCEVQTEADAAALEQTITQSRLWSDTRFEPYLPTHPRAEVSAAGPAKLPPILRTYVNWGQIRFAGHCVYQPRFQRYAIPFVGSPMAMLETLQGRGRS